jgi:hypothetical protein
VWLASALSVSSRLWLGGVVSAHRDGALLYALLGRVRSSCGPTHTVLLCVEGLGAYVTQEALKVFREAVRDGKVGRPRLVLPDGVMLAQAIKRYTRRWVVGVVRRIKRGTVEAVRLRLIVTQGKREPVINTAYIEQLQATFRARLSVLLVRRTQAPARQNTTLEAGMWLVATCYNFCCAHRSLHLRGGGGGGSGGRRWIERTPAQAAGLSDHRWWVDELLTFPVPLEPLKRRGR